jgi:hypothetical protein
VGKVGVRDETPDSALPTAAGLGRPDLGGLDLGKGKRLARRAVELIEGGVVGYALIAAGKAVASSPSSVVLGAFPGSTERVAATEERKGR